MNKLRVLFICTQNSARSQMAEEFLRQYGGEAVEVESAGLEPAGAINPLVVQAMRELGVDLAHKKPQSVFDLFRAGRLYDHVITVCDSGAEGGCPIFPGLTQRRHWPFPDPAKVTGSPEEQLAEVRRIRDLIRDHVRAQLGEVFALPPAAE